MSNAKEASNAKKTIAPKNEEYRVYRTIPQVFQPGEDGGKLHIQAAADDGRLDFIEVNKKIFGAVLGTRREVENGGGESLSLGIRNRSRASYGLLIRDGVCVGIDLLPAKYFATGTIPRVSAEATRSGFEIVWEDDHEGFDIRNEDADGNNYRLASIRATESDMVELMRGMRKHLKSTKTTHTVGSFRVRKLEDGRFRVQPVAGPDVSRVPRLAGR